MALARRTVRTWFARWLGHLFTSRELVRLGEEEGQRNEREMGMLSAAIGPRKTSRSIVCVEGLGWTSKKTVGQKRQRDTGSMFQPVP